MKKLSLAAVLFFCQLSRLFAQDTDSTYQKKKLGVVEVNLVSSYYAQEGDNSAVTGGIGTEHLTDIANTLDVQLTGTDAHQRTHTLNFELGVDMYSSASSDKIDPNTVSSASAGDRRIYPSVSYTLANTNKGFSVGAVGSYSTEYDYKSYGAGLNFSKSSKDNNRELSLKLQTYFDTWKVLLPIELRTSVKQESFSPRNSYSASLSYAQVINRRLQVALLADIITQDGLLATKYQRVYFTDYAVASEALPDKRLKIPLGIRANYFLGDRFILKAYYRYYFDDWGIRANTASLEVPVKVNPNFSVAPFFRYYTQTAADYFAPFAQHQSTETYYTSDYDLSKFNSQFYGANLRFVSEKGILGIRHFNMLELRYGHYTRSNGLYSNIISVNLRFR